MDHAANDAVQPLLGDGDHRVLHDAAMIPIAATLDVARATLLHQEDAFNRLFDEAVDRAWGRWAKLPTTETPAFAGMVACGGSAMPVYDTVGARTQRELAAWVKQFTRDTYVRILTDEALARSEWMMDMIRLDSAARPASRSDLHHQELVTLLRQGDEAGARQRLLSIHKSRHAVGGVATPAYYIDGCTPLAFGEEEAGDAG